MTRGAALFLTVVTGFSGLVYEVTWQKGLAILLGSHSEATAAVLAIFLGGLSLGYTVFGRVCRRHLARAAAANRAPRLLWIYGVVEAAIGVWALAFPFLFDAVLALSSALQAGSATLGFAVDVVWTALLIGPPTVLMGGTIPILTQALSRNLDDATRLHAWVYGFNTAGAFAGAFVAGFFLVPSLGIPGTLRAMGTANLVVGACFLMLARREPAAAVAAEPAARAPVPELRDYALAALLLGFAMMAIQTVLIRLGSLSFGASHFTFAIVVACYVLCIAVGSLVVSLVPRIPRVAVVVCPALLALSLALLYPLMQYSPWAAHVLRIQFDNVESAFLPFFLTASSGILLVLAVPLGLSGATMPLLFHDLRRRMGELGSVAGQLYAWNTVGNLLGALLGGYLLLLWIDLHHVYRLGVAAVVLAALVLAARTGSLRRAWVAAVALAVLAALPAWDPAQLSAGHFRRRATTPLSWQGPHAMLEGAHAQPLVFATDDPVQTVSVKEHRTADGRTSLAITSNGKPDGSLLADYPTMALIGLVACLYAEACEDAFVVGLGTGVTVGELAELDAMRRVRVVEISKGVIEAAPLFDEGNFDVTGRDEVEIVRSDAYRSLLHDPERWDVIASEPSNPWVSGVEMLFSREFLQAARDRLSPGGVFAQWMHSYEMDAATLELVLRTYASVFEDVAVWYLNGPDLLLLGFQDASRAPDFDALARRAARPDFRRGLERAGVGSWAELVGHELLPRGILHADALPGRLHTLRHPILSHLAARAFFLGKRAFLPRFLGPEAAEVGRRGSLLGQLDARGGLDDASWSALTGEVCATRPQECATLHAAWQGRALEATARREALARDRAGPSAGHLDPERLALLSSYFADGPRRTLDVASAKRASEIYRQYSHHALPFRREALARLWRGCRGPDCTHARQRARAELGPF